MQHLLSCLGSLELASNADRILTHPSLEGKKCFSLDVVSEYHTCFLLSEL